MITVKANSAKRFPQHNLAKCSPCLNPPVILCTLVCPILECAYTAWSPYYQQSILKVEMVQWQAARFVTNNYNRTASVTDMLHYLQWDALKVRHKTSCHTTI